MYVAGRLFICQQFKRYDMRTGDFEKAIAGLGGTIFIDEVLLKEDRQVDRMYGHTSHVWIKWDGFGKSYTCYSEDEIEMEPQEPRCEVDRWERDKVYDLRFERLTDAVVGFKKVSEKLRKSWLQLSVTLKK